MSPRAFLSRLRHDRRGATVIEFAIIAPVMIALIMGLGELLYQTYIQSILDGAVQKAGRDSALEGNADPVTDAALDAKVTSMLQTVAPNVQPIFKRTSYPSFAQVSKPELIYDTNGNGKLDPGECFDDVNNNGVWDADPGVSGQGGANDVTRYEVTITYPRLFPVVGLFGWTPTQQLVARTLLKNQPYKAQIGYSKKCV